MIVHLLYIIILLQTDWSGKASCPTFWTVECIQYIHSTVQIKKDYVLLIMTVRTGTVTSIGIEQQLRKIDQITHFLIRWLKACLVLIMKWVALRTNTYISFLNHNIGNHVGNCYCKKWIMLINMLIVPRNISW